MTRPALIAGALSFSLAAHAMAEPPKSVRIPPGPMVPALQLLSKQLTLQLIYQPKQLASFRTGGVSGNYSARDAVQHLLAGTHLKVEFDPSGAMAIVPPGLARPEAQRALKERNVEPNASTPSQSGGKERRRPSSSSFHLAQANMPRAAGDDSVESQQGRQNTSTGTLRQVLVTAQKTAQPIQEVPVAVSVLNTQALIENNAVRLQDYFSSVPGLDVTPEGNGGITSITIRGISSGPYTPSTVVILIDGIPLYNGLSAQFSNVQPDLDPADLERVEVLRGPQGTLFGASSMGGLINYVTVSPSTSAVSGHVEVGGDSVYNGAEPGYNARGEVNLPINNTLAMRVSAYTRQDPGYIDNPTLGIDGVNEDHASGGLLSALWRISDNASAKVSALYQDSKGDGQNEVDVPTAGYPQTTGLTGLEQNHIRGVGGWEQKFQLYTAILKANVGAVKLVSLSGYSINEWNNSQDFSTAAGSLAQPIFGVSGVGLFNAGADYKFTEEARASLPIGKKLDWLVGGFYTHENYPTTQNIPVQNPATGEVAGSLGFDASPHTYEEYAVFTDLTVHITHRFDVQLGGRESHIEQGAAEQAVEGGILFGGGITTIPPVNSTSNVFTYLLTPKYTVSKNLMLYARLASGFRPGLGVNTPPNPDFPKQQDPDKTRDYEIGMKGSGFGHRLAFDASLYYIDWRDIEITLVDPMSTFSYGANGGGAKSEGAELSAEARPLPGLTISGWAAYDDAVLTQALPQNSAAYGPEGSRLPFGSGISGNLKLNQAFRVTGNATGFVGGAISCVGDRMGSFLGDATPRQYYPGYAQLNLNGGVMYEAWTVNLYVNNLADKRGLLGGGTGTAPGAFAFTYIQPRTVGVTVGRQF